MIRLLRIFKLFIRIYLKQNMCKYNLIGVG